MNDRNMVQIMGQWGNIVCCSVIQMWKILTVSKGQTFFSRKAALFDGVRFGDWWSLVLFADKLVLLASLGSHRGLWADGVLPVRSRV